MTLRLHEMNQEKAQHPGGPTSLHVYGRVGCWSRDQLWGAVPSNSHLDIRQGPPTRCSGTFSTSKTTRQASRPSTHPFQPTDWSVCLHALLYQVKVMELIVIIQAGILFSPACPIEAAQKKRYAIRKLSKQRPATICRGTPDSWLCWTTVWTLSFASCTFLCRN